jgi:hypothetical protein
LSQNRLLSLEETIEFSQANEAVKKFLDRQKHFTQRRKVAEDAKKTKELLFANLCTFA